MRHSLENETTNAMSRNKRTNRLRDRRSDSLVRKLLIEVLEPRELLAAMPQLIDINQQVAPLSSFPSQLMAVGDEVFFTANDGFHGAELWKSDGTDSGAVLVRDIASGIESSTPANLTNVGGVLYFTANDGLTGVELWKSDGSEAGAVLVKDIRAGSAGASPAFLTNLNGTLFFTATDGAGARKLWKTNGTEAGTVSVTEKPAFGLTRAGNAIYFRIGGDLWKTETGSENAVFLKEIKDGSSGIFDFLSQADAADVAGSLFFSVIQANGVNQLWKSDGSSGGTLLVRDFPARVPLDLAEAPRYFAPINGTLYFVVGESGTGIELWKSDGTEAGTIRVKDIFSGPASSYPTSLVNVNGTLFFNAFNGGVGYELWKSDGTETGTTPVKQFNKGPFNPGPNYLTNVGGTLFFSAVDQASGRELWRSDGTEAGTVTVKDINLGNESSFPGNLDDNGGTLVNVGGVLYFRSNDGVTGYELWKSNGTEAGTVRVKDIFTGTGDSNPTRPIDNNGTLYFRANDGLSGNELWKSDGTNSGTVRVKDIRSGPYGSDPRYLTNVGGILFFAANDGVSGFELWKSDGLGAVRVKDVLGGASAADPRQLVNVGGTLFFAATDIAGGRELWKSDGTEEGTVRVKDIRPGFGSSSPYSLVNVNSILYFTANDGSTGEELWKSDGTEAGTVRVKDLRTGLASSLPSQLVSIGETLYFRANDGVNGLELWKSDGTEAGTALVKDIFVGSEGSYPNLGTRTIPPLMNVSGMVYFAANDGASGLELWKSDGTDMGTVRVKDIRSGGGSSLATSTTSARPLAANVDGVYFFSANDGVNGEELWKSDGTSAGTVLVKNIDNQVFSSAPKSLINLGGTLFFAAKGGDGDELWTSDGTAKGTVLVSDIVGGSTNSNYSGSFPSYLATAGGKLYFSANDIVHGRELWVLDLEPSDAIAGDFDRNGIVDGTDFLSWQRSVASAAVPAGAGADGDGSGLVDSGDLSIWISKYGQAAPYRSSALFATQDSEWKGAGKVFEKIVDDVFRAGDFTVCLHGDQRGQLLSSATRRLIGVRRASVIG